MHTDVVWEKLETRKALSLRERFEVRKAIWRERGEVRTAGRSTLTLTLTLTLTPSLTLTITHNRTLTRTRTR